MTVRAATPAARCAALALALLATACGGGSKALNANLGAPSAVATFTGVTRNHDGETRLYVAVAANRGNELKILDPDGDRPVLGPTLVFPLSIPTDARPLKLAAASLGDGLPDVLVVASPTTAGGPRIELVETWTTSNQIAAEIPLGLGAEAEIVSLTAGPIPGLANAARVIAGVVAADGPHLVVVDFTRAATGPAIVATAPVVRPALSALAGPIEPLDLALSPTGDRLFVATADPIAPGPRFGVAELAVTAGAAADWTVTPLDARGPTRLVAAAMVTERQVLDRDAAGTVVGPTVSPDVFPADSAALRVYAALDPAGCGTTRAIRCGIATLLPSDQGGGLAPDPAKVLSDALPSQAPAGMSYRAPIEIPGVPLTIAVSGPPGTVSSGICTTEAVARVLLAPTTGQRCTSTMAVVTSTDGGTYVLDLGRFQSPSELSTIRSPSTRTRVTSAVSTVPVDPTTGQPLGATLGLEADDGTVQSFGAPLRAAVTVTPGFTDTDVWTVTYQGLLPGLEVRRGVVLRVDGVPWLAVQTRTVDAAGNPIWLESAQVGAPELGVRADDIAHLTMENPDLCGAGALLETTITGGVAAIRPPDPVNFPGGALQLPEGCWSANLAEGQWNVVQALAIRASGFVLTNGEGRFYAGRPELDQPFALQWSEADDPADVRELRDERQALARKARRRFYPADNEPCASLGGTCGDFPRLVHPLFQGPAVAFKLRLASAGTPARTASLTFATSSGYAAMARRPIGATLATGAAAVDRTRVSTGTDLGIRWYVAYQGDQVFVFGPGEALSQSFSIR